MYYLNKNINVREKLAFSAIIVFLLLPTISPFLNKLWHAFTVPNCFNYRYSFTLIFTFILMGARELQNKNIVKSGILQLVEECLDDLHYSNALETIWQIISAGNKYIDETKPWVLFKSEDEQDKQKLASVMANLVEALRIVAVLIQPFMSDTANKIFEQLNINVREWDSSHEFIANRGNIKVVQNPEPLFVRLEVEKELEYLENIIKGK